MKEPDLIYLAGLIDGIGTLEVDVSPHKNYAIGYRFEPRLRMGLTESDTAVLGMLDEYCEEVGVSYQIQESGDSDALRFIVQDSYQLYNFIEPFADYLIRNFDATRIMLNEILPRVKDEDHRTKQGFYDLMEYVDELRTTTGRGREPKYTREYFAKEWGDEIKT